MIMSYIFSKLFFSLAFIGSVVSFDYSIYSLGDSSSLSATDLYCKCAFVYSGVRKLVYTWGTKYQDIVYDQNHTKIITTKPILYVDRCVHFLYSGFLGIPLAPLYILCDIRKIEMIIHNIKLSHKFQHLSEGKGFLDVMMDQHL